MRVEFGELRLGVEAKNNLLDVIETNWASGGPKVKKFEEEWGKLFGYGYNVAVSNGTAADTVACMALYDRGAEREDEIIAPALAFAAVGESILMAGFKPVFVDIERETLNINPHKIEEKITPRTRGIMVVHTMGKPCKMDIVLNIAKDNNLTVIEDSCEAHGARYKDKFVGNWGDMATFSYYIAHLVCCGEGGMVSTNNPELADILKSVRIHGRKNGALYFDHIRPGLNAKMNDLEASIGLPEISRFWDTFNKRSENLNYLLKKTRDLREFAFFNAQEPEEVVCPHAFSVTLKHPKYNCPRLYRYLEEKSIKCKRNFGSMPTQHQAFKFLRHKKGDFSEAEYVGDNGLHLGVHQYLKPEDLSYVSDCLHNYFKLFD